MQAWIFRSSQPSHKKKYPSNPNSRLLTLLAATLATTLFLLFIFRHTLIDPNSLCIYTAKPLHLTDSESLIAAEFDDTPLTLVTILHYATALALPQQTKGEIRRTFDVLQSLAPCNFLVFGLGHDSLMWDSFNPRGTTLFLEEDPKWTLAALQRFPIIHAHTVRYQTRLSDHPLKGDLRCVLALSNLPNDVYDRDWDVIMIDGPRGYFPAAPGRMAVIYSAAMMARGRRNSGVTHVFLHDVDREIEKHYAREFLCMKYRVGGIRKLWHFVIPPVVNATDISHGFC
ncbi:hypothetical protein V8G54_020974 [Vigna mungo]|uniref:Polysaccharide biosynthesis domain-containing protein n=1 Tax=Vigna mungo TaxID=3915 RepID=A0AAQ3NGJ4_VIGMU